MLELFYTEIPTVTIQMLEDRNCYIVSDGTLFLITIKNNASSYKEFTFQSVGEEAIYAYDLVSYFGGK